MDNSQASKVRLPKGMS
uniref:Uncharacterized protein n=1 Tax=Vitis vinifera TaxID=29760 RepID=F6HFW0_VITVI